MQRRPRVAVVGSLHFDVMLQTPHLPRLGETLIGERWWWKPGGKGGNQAMAAAQHGADVAMIGCLGDDLFGERLRGRLEAAGVGLEHVRTSAQGSGMSVAIQQAGGDYAAIVVSGANREIDAAQVAASATAIGAADVLVLQNEIPAETDLAAAALARQHGTRVVLNAAPARPLGPLAGLVDVLVVNAVEAEQLAGHAVNDPASALDAARVLACDVPAVVVTAGPHGVVGVDRDTQLALPAHLVEGPETHGAGDVFTGALATRLAAGDRLEPALRYANAAAALHVGRAEAERARVGPADVQALLSGAADG